MGGRYDADRDRMKIVSRQDKPDNGDGSYFTRLVFEHEGKVCEWGKTVRLYPDTKWPWWDLQKKATEAYRDITGDMTRRCADVIEEAEARRWFPEIK